MYETQLSKEVSTQIYRRGNIVWVDFGQPVGSEQGGIRPALIVQNNKGNEHSPCIIVLPVTTSSTKHRIPTQTEISVNGRWSIAYGEQIRTVDKKRVLEDNGVADTIVDMECINKALRISLAL